MSDEVPTGAEPGAPAAIAGADSGPNLAESMLRLLGRRVTAVPNHCGELSFDVPTELLLEVATLLRDGPEFKFEICADVCGVDYLQYGLAEWKTVAASTSGFSRGVSRVGASGETIDDALASKPTGRRFAVVYHLLSIALNQRMRLRVYCADDEQPIVDSVTAVWASADWFERETFDLFGILFRGHPDLRRLLTDYGFIGHPFRKDFPVSGNVEVRYDPEKRRVIYQPVTIDPRILVPKVIRQDNRYDPQLTTPKPNG